MTQDATARGTILVTGSRRGIGFATARALARAGYGVVVSDVDEDDVAAAVETLRAEGLERVRGVVLDVRDRQKAFETLAAIDAETPLYGLVNNAGVKGGRPLLEVDEDFFDEVYSVNIRGLYFMLQSAVRLMLPRGEGIVVNVASTSGFVASISPATVYDTSKGAVKSLTIAASKEFANTGLRINAVAPGTIETPMVQAGRRDNPAVLESIEAAIPLRRLGMPEEIAAAVVFLCSPGASYVMGHTLVVDGGWLT